MESCVEYVGVYLCHQSKLVGVKTPKAVPQGNTHCALPCVYYSHNLVFGARSCVQSYVHVCEI